MYIYFKDLAQVAVGLLSLTPWSRLERSQHHSPPASFFLFRETCFPLQAFS